MSTRVVGSRCESAGRLVANSSLKRLRLETNSYSERLAYRPIVWSGWWSLPAKKEFATSPARHECPQRPRGKVQGGRSVLTPLQPKNLPRPHHSKPSARSFSQQTTIQNGAIPPTQETASSPQRSSVSSSEVSHFSSLASTWWDPHGPSRLLHLMNPLRHDFIRLCHSTTSAPPSSLSYLDIGCGGGIFSASCALMPNTSSITAIDPTPACIQAAKAHARTDPALSPPPAGKLTFLNTTIEDLKTTAPDFEPVDIVTLFEVIEHIATPSVFLESCIPHLKTGGWLIGSTIARHPLSYITTKLIAEAPIVGVVPRGTHDWNQYINPDELHEWLQTKAPGRWDGFTVQGVVYVPGLGWRPVQGSENYGNYFFGIQKLE